MSEAQLVITKRLHGWVSPELFSALRTLPGWPPLVRRYGLQWQFRLGPFFWEVHPQLPEWRLSDFLRVLREAWSRAQIVRPPGAGGEIPTFSDSDIPDGRIEPGAAKKGSAS